MGDEDSSAEWRKNLKGKSEEIRSSIMHALTRLHVAGSNSQEFQNACSTLVAHAASMEMMYATNSRPHLLAEIKSNAGRWSQRPGDTDILKWMVDAHDRMVAVGDGKPPKNPLGIILLEYAKDAELNVDLNELQAQLKRLLDEGENELVSSIVKELRKILEEIETLQGKALIEIEPWLEFLISTLGTVGGSVTSGNPLFGITASALILTVRSRKRIVKLYGEAKMALLKGSGLKRSSQIAIDISDLTEFDRLENEGQASEMLKERAAKALPPPSD
jgi:hypothetical protein